MEWIWIEINKEGSIEKWKEEWEWMELIWKGKGEEGIYILGKEKTNE